ncbi:MAG: DNA ligase D [Armatimonadota bacterium]|nr:DNA ligase D [Armatimonadota bacterium]
MAEEYDLKRDFTKTPEPPMERKAGGAQLRFVIQKHRATQLHYDLRLELDGALKSWAVPKGPSLNPADKRLAMMVEDHPIDYGDFEGIIPEGYGAGEVIVWDSGTYAPDEETDPRFFDREEAEAEMRRGFEKGKLGIFLMGSKLKGSYALVQMKGKEKEWLFFKHKDLYAAETRDILQEDRSVFSGLTIGDLQAGMMPPTHYEYGAPAEMDRKMRPMAASSATESFDGEDWIFEPKMDGIRVLAFIEKGEAQLFSRNGNDLTKQYPSIVTSLGKQPMIDAIIDGEIVAFDEQGKPSFHVLQQRMHLTNEKDIVVAESQVPAVFFAFDILHKNGLSYVAAPLMERKRLVKQSLLPDHRVLVLDYFETHGRAAYDASIRSGFEGIVAKKRLSKYEPGNRSKNWIKVKDSNSAEFVVGGYTTGMGGRSSTFGALLLGVPEDGKLRFVGGVGSGFNEKQLKELLPRLKELETDKNPFIVVPPLKAPAKWTRPEVVAEVNYHQFTPEGHLRAPTFKTIRFDIEAEDVETTEFVDMAATKTNNVEAALEQIEKAKHETVIKLDRGEFKVTNPDKVLWPQAKYTKRDLLRYFALVSPYLVPHLENRPLTLSRYPNGIDKGMFYQKHWEHGLPSFVTKVDLFSNNEDQEYLVCDNMETLLWLGQLADLELHPWTSRTEPNPDAIGKPTVYTGSEGQIESSILNYPDYVLFDIDPYIYSGKESKGAEPEYNKQAFDKGREIAFKVKELLDTLKVKSFIKTSGKTGLHIYVPIVRDFTYTETRSAAQTLSHAVLAAHPTEVTVEWSVDKRTGKIFMDFGQNARGKTLASIYSPRAVEGAPVSMPVSWEHLPDIWPADFDIKTVPGILKDTGDPWKDILKAKNDLGKILGLH